MRAEWGKAVNWLTKFREETFMVFFVGSDGRGATKHWVGTDLGELLNYLESHDKIFLAMVPFGKAIEVRKRVCSTKTVSYADFFKTVDYCLVCNGQTLILNKYGVLTCPNCRRFFLSATLNKEMD